MSTEQISTDRYADSVKCTFALANQFAGQAGCSEVGPEHLLLALLRRPEGGVARVFQSTGLDVQRVRGELEAFVRPGHCHEYGKLRQSTAAKRVIARAADEAIGLGHTRIGTEHLLLGLLSESEGIMPDVLMRSGLELRLIREQVQRLLPPVSAPPTGDAAESRRRAIEEERLRIEEQSRIHDLREKLASWQEAQLIRSFVADLRASASNCGVVTKSDSQLNVWLQWALRRADQLDPTDGILRRYSAVR